MVIYGVSGQQSISKMFMAGIIPGILIAIGLSVMHFFLCRNLKTEGLDWSLKTFIHSLRDGFWSILAPVIILGGIYAGILRRRKPPSWPFSTPSSWVSSSIRN